MAKNLNFIKFIDIKIIQKHDIIALGDTMCLKENTITMLQNIFLYSGIIIPLLYVLRCAVHKKKRKYMPKHLLIALLVGGGIFLVRLGFEQTDKCNSDTQPVGNNISSTTTSSTTLSTTTTTISATTTPTSTSTTTKKTTTTTKSSDDGYIGTSSKGYSITKKSGAYYVDGYLIVNKSYALSSSWVPKNTYSKISAEICKTCIDKTAYADWQRMKSDATAIGLNIYIASGYRSYQYQKGLYESYLKKDSKAKVDTYSARAGHSEHQSGLAFDLNSVNDSFAATAEGKWIAKNAYLYGYIIRYPKGKTDETGYKYEPWHLRYVGADLAKKLYNDGDWLTMESYFGLDSKYSS